MARGFESKDVEFQQAEAQRGTSRARPLTADEREALDRRRTLELTLVRARADLNAAALARPSADARATRSPRSKQQLTRLPG